MNSIARKILTALTLLFFVGQVMASSAVACEMGSNVPLQVVEEHHGHHSEGSENSDSHHDDCCDKSGNCTMSGCIAMATMSQDNELKIVHLDKTPVSLNSLHIDLISSSLYRPPILV